MSSVPDFSGFWTFPEYTAFPVPRGMRLATAIVTVLVPEDMTDEELQRNLDQSIEFGKAEISMRWPTNPAEHPDDPTDQTAGPIA